jgi:hypothetical protein
VKLPVIYVHRPTGSASDDICSKSPVVDVAVGWSERGQSDRKLFKVRALVDSGADEIYIDHSILTQAKCPEIAGQTAQVKSQHGLKTHKLHQAVILFPGLNAEGQMMVVAAEFDPATYAYQAVFGTKFLELGELVLNPRGESHFTIHSQSTKSASTP